MFRHLLGLFLGLFFIVLIVCGGAVFSAWLNNATNGTLGLGGGSFWPEIASWPSLFRGQEASFAPVAFLIAMAGTIMLGLVVASGLFYVIKPAAEFAIYFIYRGWAIAAVAILLGIYYFLFKM